MITQLPLLLGIFVALTVLFVTIYFANDKVAAKKKKPLILYLIVAAIMIGITGALGFFDFTELSIRVFTIGLLWTLTIGILHTWLYHKFYDSNILGEILFTLAIGFMGYALIFLVYKFYFKNPFPRIFILPLFCFFAPVFIQIAFDNFIRIPIKIFKTWDFPSPGTLSDPSDAEMADPIIVNFEIRKQSNDSHTVFKAKAPKGMLLGRLFYFFIMDYNSRHPDNPIIVVNEPNNLFQWFFHTKSGLFGGKIHLDPDVSIVENNIKENSTVTCERFLPYK